MVRETRTAQEQAELTLWHKQHAWNPYRLRHSAATETRELFGLEATQGLCGHANRSMTERYAGVDISKTADAVRRHRARCGRLKAREGGSSYPLTAGVVDLIPLFRIDNLSLAELTRG